MAKSNSKKSRSERKKAAIKATNKNVVAKEEKKSPFALSDEDIERVKQETSSLITQLEKKLNNVFLFKKKPLIKSQIKDLQILLEQEQYYLLNSKLKAIKELEKKEKEEVEEEKKELEKNKTEKKKKSWSEIKTSIKNFNSWPIYSRTKRIIENYSGKERTQRLIVVYSIIFVLLVIALIGLLMCVNVINYDISGDNEKIGRVICLVVPIACLFFV